MYTMIVIRARVSTCADDSGFLEVRNYNINNSYVNNDLCSHPGRGSFIVFIRYHRMSHRMYSDVASPN